MILITRPAEDSAATVAEAERLGFRALAAPSLIIRDSMTSLPDPALYDASMFTSINGVRAFLRRGPGAAYSGKPVFAVGDHTAALLRAAGFKDVRSAAGDFGDLVALMTRTMVSGRVAHFRGRDVSADAAAALPGWQIDGIVLYQADPIGRIDDSILAHLKKGDIAAALFYSARTADAFRAALVQSWPDAALNRTKALCIADTVVESLSGLKWAEILVSDHPDQARMLQLLTRV